MRAERAPRLPRHESGRQAELWSMIEEVFIAYMFDEIHPVAAQLRFEKLWRRYHRRYL